MKNYVPILITNGDKKGIWQIDITHQSTLELIKLRELLKDTTFEPTILALDRLIYNNIDEFRCSTNILRNGYQKEQKRNRKIAKNAKKKKVRRR